MGRFIRNRRTEAGQGLVEYALLVALIAVVVIAVLSLVAPQINAAFQQVIFALGGGYQYDYQWAKTFNVRSDNTVDCNIYISSSGMGVLAKQNGQPVSGVTIAVLVQLHNGASKTFTGQTDANGKVIWSDAYIGQDSVCGANTRIATASIASLTATAVY